MYTYYKIERFIIEAKTGNAIGVTPAYFDAAITVTIGGKTITLSSATPTFDLGRLFYPYEVLNSEPLKDLLLKGRLLSYAGTTRLDYAIKDL